MHLGAGSLELDRAGVEVLDSRHATGLDLLVAGSDRAVALAREAHHNLLTGDVLTWTGLGIVVASGISALAFFPTTGANNGTPSSTTTAWTITFASGLAVGLVLDIIAIPFMYAGLHQECDAVNAYNSDLVDGRLQAPVPSAVPGG